MKKPHDDLQDLGRFSEPALFILISSYPTVLSSLQLREAFPDTANPGYFVIKMALWIMAVTILMQALLDIARPLPREND